MAASSPEPTPATPPTSTSPGHPLPPTPGQEYRRRVRRLSAVWAIVVVVVAVIAGAVGYELHTTPTSTSNSAVSLTFFDDLAPSESSWMTGTIIPMFETAHPNVTVVYSDLGASQIVTDVQALVKGNDVGTMVIGEDNMVIGELVYANDLMNLGSVASQIQPATMIPSMAGIVNYETTAFGGEYFIPLRANVPLTWYNATFLSNAGIKAPPANDTQLLSDAQALTTAAGGVGQVMFQGHGGASTPTELFQWMTQYGGNPILFNTTGDIRAMQYLYNLSAYFNPGYKTAYWATYSGLAAGQYSLLDYQWPYVYGLLQGLGMTNASLGVYAGPAGPANSDHLIGGDVLAIPKGTQNLWAASTFSAFLLSTPVQQAYILNLSTPAVNAAAYANLPPSISTVYSAIEAALANPVFRPPVPWITEWNTLMDDAWSKIIVNQGGYGSIASTLSSENAALYAYLQANYGATTASSYESGAYGPLIVT